MSGPPDVVLYSRRSCHLCDEARVVIAAERAHTPFPFEEIFIDGNDELEAEYGLRVPVVAVGGTVAFEFVVEPAQLRDLVHGRPR